MADAWVPVSTAVLESGFTGVAAVQTAPEGITPLRLHPDLLRRSPDGLALMAEFTSGVRLRLVTAADRLRLTAVFTRYVMAHLDHAVSRAEVLAEIDGVVVDRAVADPTALVAERKDAPLERGAAVESMLELTLGSASEPREVVLWLPADAGVRILALEATAEVVAAPTLTLPRWVHHGSSISHGGDAADARSTWPAQAARALGLAGTNLGFGGNAMIDPPVARAIARLDADVITLSFGINIVTGDAMRRRVFGPALHGFLDTVRDAHPEVPIVVISAISCPGFEDLPGPRRLDENGRLTGTSRPGDAGALSLSATRDAIAEVLAARTDDPRLFGMDGRDLLGPDDVHHLYDGLHPDPAGYDLMARRFVALARDPGHPLGRAFLAATPAG
ncbi:GDSL-type esterase/lipase family protein [Pseudolysinimonas sp.]|jgi:hypothetical protein|uniref:GDSL-type esterase/lipase family protein n=1 Tax=Pseudolysinimonas sp. TaxID=2680009 RepID=UPI0037843B41